MGVQVHEVLQRNGNVRIGWIVSSLYFYLWERDPACAHTFLCALRANPSLASHNKEREKGMLAKPKD